MANLILILGENLDHTLPALVEADRQRDEVIMIESGRKAHIHPWHRHKLAFVWANMREFAHELAGRDYKVNYVTVDKSAAHRFREILAVRFHKGRFDRLIVTVPTGRSALHHLRELGKLIPIDMKPNNAYLLTDADYAGTPPGLTLQQFHRHHAVKLSFCVKFDPRSLLKAKSPAPVPIPHGKEAKLVLTYLDKHFAALPGDPATFSLPTTEAQVAALLEAGAHTDWHTLNACLNVGRLLPQQLAQSQNLYTLQMLVTREYWRYLYLSHHQTALSLSRQLPKSVFGFEPFTDMRCLDQVTSRLTQTGILGDADYISVVQNMALLLSAAPKQIAKWFEIHSLAAEWEAEARIRDSVLHTSINAANFINTNTTYCKGCKYLPTRTSGDRACPFNYMFWQFLVTYADSLDNVPELRTHYSRLKHMPAEQKQDISHLAEKFRQAANRQLTYRQVPASGKH